MIQTKTRLQELINPGVANGLNADSTHNYYSLFNGVKDFASDDLINIIQILPLHF
jgi:hypothetical protein